MGNEGVVMLSVLIPSIPSRADKLAKLTQELERQKVHTYATCGHLGLGDLEVVVDDSAGFMEGGLSIGKKREALVKRANGRYLNFLDDDDNISPNYIETLLKMCNTNADVCTFRAFVKLNEGWGLVDMSLKYQFNEQFTPEYTVRRKAWHTCPIKSEFAKLYDFKDINSAEDFEWTERVLTHCVTETHTEQILFEYNHGDHSESDKILRNGQV